MSNDLVKLPTPMTIEEVVYELPELSMSLGWGVQSMVRDTVRAMVLLASARSEHYRYALAVSSGIGQYLYDQPQGAITSKEHFLRCTQVGSRIGHFDNLETHVLQTPVNEGEERMMLLILDDNQMVDSYIMTQLRDYTDHVVINNILPRNHQ